MELDDNVYDKITQLSKEGNKLINTDKFDEAVEIFNEALNLVPEPKTEWEASTWLYTAIGDAFFLKRDYNKSLESFYDAYNCPDAVDNPFINLRLGQSLFELEQIEKAEDFLMRAYMLDGTKVFRGDGKKYLAYMRKKYDL
jgi:tetratricopeptide (TPR) repeat protein